ncbi:MAG: SDR family oxidoreductase [Desulfobacteraceae bacterium]|nr:SDR family oxidoreductase [Desulfobacteraceae bacterium]MBC2749973.1 SDR family oxidoreductase [Desulfobacteraceae bacterium]
MVNEYERIAIVTGSTSGIGEATARRFISAGMGVVGNGRNVEKLATLETEFGPSFSGVVGDAADADVLEKLFSQASDRFGKSAGIVVVNAGRGLDGSVMNADLSQVADMLNVNVTGAFALLQKAAWKLVDHQQGGYPDTKADIVIIGSVVGRHVSPFSSVYGASKFAVHSLSEALRRELGPKGIRVSLVEPGMVRSGFQAIAGYSDEMVKNLEDKYGPIPVGDDIADAILYIVSQPPHVHVSNIVVRPTRQDYP